MIAKLLPLVFLSAQPVPAPTDTAGEDAPVALNTAQEGAIRCSAAFALVAERQRQGDEAALKYPALGERGREFFVRSSAQLMDEAHLDRIQIEARLRGAADAILAENSIDQIMPACLLLLDASGL